MDYLCLFSILIGSYSQGQIYGGGGGVVWFGGGRTPSLASHELRNCHALLLTLREKPGFRWWFFSQYSYYGYLAVFRQPRIQTGQYLDNTVLTNQNRDKEDINK